MGLGPLLAPEQRRITRLRAASLSKEDRDRIARDLNGPPRDARFVRIGRPPVLLSLEEEGGRLAIRATPAKATRRIALLLFWSATLICAIHQVGEFRGARLWPVQLAPSLVWVATIGLDALFPRVQGWLWLKRAEGVLENRLHGKGE